MLCHVAASIWNYNLCRSLISDIVVRPFENINCRAILGVNMEIKQGIRIRVHSDPIGRD